MRRFIPREEKIQVISADLERALSARGFAVDPQLHARDRILVFDLTANRARTVAPITDDLKLQASGTTPAQVVFIGGEVRVPGLYPLEPSMRISDLIRAGGSLEDSAYSGEAEISRYEAVDSQERQTALLGVKLT